MAYELFVDGFDYYSTADVPKKWEFNFGCVVTPAIGRRGTPGLEFSAGGSVGRSTTQSTKGVIGAAVKFSSGNRGWYGVVDDATLQLYLVIGSDQKLYLHRGPSTVIAVSANAVTYGQWYYMELGFTIGNPGTIELRMDGASVGWIPPTSINTQNTGNAYFNRLYLGTSNPLGVLDDVYFTYGDEIKFLGDSRVDTLILTADSTPQDWTPDSGNAWERLNGTGYVSATTVGASSLFSPQTLSINPAVIHGVQVDAHINKSDAGAKSAATLIKSGATTTTGSNLVLSTDQKLARSAYILNPTTSGVWSKSEVNSMTIGVKVTA